MSKPEELPVYRRRRPYEAKDKPCYEFYHNDASEHPEGEWIVDICIPLKSDRL